MIERYCDVCGQQMERVDKTVFELDKVKVSAWYSVGGIWNSGDVCIPCIRTIVAEGVVVVDVT